MELQQGGTGKPERLGLQPHEGVVLESKRGEAFLVETSRGPMLFMSAIICNGMTAGVGIVFMRPISGCGPNEFVDLRTGDHCEVVRKCADTAEGPSVK